MSPGKVQTGPTPAKKRGLIVAVSGGRYFEDAKMVARTLGKIRDERGIRLLIEGGCNVWHGGADELCRKWAKDAQINCLSVPAKWREHGTPEAGPIRNREIASFKPSLWVFFPGGRGTKDARSVAEMFGIEIVDAE